MDEAERPRSDGTSEDLSPRAFAVALLVALAVAALLRGLFPAADPPWNPTVGVVWHDEGAWVHNARNKALFGAWSPGQMESDVYRAGVHRARIPVVQGRSASASGRRGSFRRSAGLLSVWLLALGVARLAGRRAGVMAAALLGTNYVYVMWNRAATDGRPRWSPSSWRRGTATRARTRTRAGARRQALCALLAFFTKAAAAFFVAALALDAGITLVAR